MSYAYTRGSGSGAFPPPRSSSLRNHFVEPPSLLVWVRDSLPPQVQLWIAELWTRAVSSISAAQRRTRQRGGYKREAWRAVKRVFSIANALILLWLFTLWWGERTVFRDSVESCTWDGWERWVSYSRHSPLPTALFADSIPSLKSQHRIMWLSSQTLSWSIPTHTLAGRGRYPPSLSCIQTST